MIQEPSAKGVISSCYDTGSGRIRMVNSGAHCAAGENKLTWQQHPAGVVHLTGLGCQSIDGVSCRSATEGSGTATVFTLPAGFRP